jgi:hypothetical protein
MSNVALGVGAGLSILGLGGLAYWCSRQRASKPKETPNETSKVPVYYASLREGTFDEDIGGGWIVRDVRAVRTAPIDTDRDVHIGNIISLFLQHGVADVKVFNVRVVGITGDDFSGQWVSGQPAGGPQMIDFRGAHIFSYH